MTLIENKTLFTMKLYDRKKLLFLLPTGAAGKGFVEEMIRLVNSWT